MTDSYPFSVFGGEFKGKRVRVCSARRLAPTLLPDIQQGPQFRILLLPQFSKGGTHFFDKNGRLLKSGEMAAVLRLVPIDEI
jgi:hypothetical protein